MRFVLLLFALSSPLAAETPIQALTAYYAAETGVPLYIAHGLRLSESSDRRYLITGTSAGYWQLNRLWHEDFKARYNGGQEFSEFDPVASTRIALRLLAALYRQTGRWVTALEWYKCGPRGTVPEAIRAVCLRIVREGYF